ncbi:hypothetical protein Bbelb_233820 [Branchiostoma belcheri]|nr:hypothetical protein Bbelb_233820 [Branchiostoma belcheri]
MGKRKEPTHKPVPCGVWVSKKRQKQLLLPQPKRARLSSVTVIPARQLGGARELPKRQATIMEIFGRKDADSAASVCSMTSSQVFDSNKSTIQDHQKAPDSDSLDAEYMSPESDEKQSIQKTSQENFSTAQRDSTVVFHLSDKEEYSYSLTDDSQNDQTLSPLKYTLNSQGNLKLKTPTKLPCSETSDDIFTQNQTVNDSEIQLKTTWKSGDVMESGEHVKHQKTKVEKLLQQTEKHEDLSPPMYTLDTQGDLKVKFRTEHCCPQNLGHQTLTLHEKSMIDAMPCSEALSPLQYTLDTQGELVYNDNHRCGGAGSGQSEESHSLMCEPGDEETDDGSQSEEEELSQLRYTLDSEGELRLAVIDGKPFLDLNKIIRNTPREPPPMLGPPVNSNSPRRMTDRPIDVVDGFPITARRRANSGSRVRSVDHRSTTGVNTDAMCSYVCVNGPVLSLAQSPPFLGAEKSANKTSDLGDWEDCDEVGQDIEHDFLL